MAHKATFPKGDAREDWAIMRALSEYLSAPLPFDDLLSLRHKLYSDYPHLRHIGGLPSHKKFSVNDIAKSAKKGKALNGVALSYKPFDFYQTDVIARASKTMQECSKTYGEISNAE